MASQRKLARLFNGMRYGEVQRLNSQNRSKLKVEHQQWLKENHYRNVGWEPVIALFQKIQTFLEQAQFEDLDLEALFLEADRVGHRYQTAEEITTFNQQLAQEVNDIAELVDQQFPDAEVEVIDFRTPSNQKPRDRKIYRTAK
jgi:hypothetical protein